MADDEAQQKQRFEAWRECRREGRKHIDAEAEQQQDHDPDDETEQRAFADAFMILSRRIALMVNLPLEKLDRLALQKELVDIGRQKA